MKRLNNKEALKSVPEKDFEVDAEALGSLNHRNVVPLLGAFVGTKPRHERLLVYENCGENLELLLRGEGESGEVAKEAELRRWEVRRSIALDAARGLKYLHHECDPPVVHHDVKPAKLIVDKHAGFVARLAEPGVTTDADLKKMESLEHIEGEPVGRGDEEEEEVQVEDIVPLASSEGYVAPEFSRLHRLGMKGDVYAYGVTLLRLVTGRRPTDPGIKEVGLARWVGTHAAATVVDPNMEVSEDEKDQVLGALWLGLLCISPVPVDRPSMDEVVSLLEHLDELAQGMKARQM